MARVDDAMLSAERVAASARSLLPSLCEQVRIHADGLASALASEHQLVAWDRELAIGQLQQRLERLRHTRARTGSTLDPAALLERAQLPLESVDRVWRELLAGRCVRLEHEHGACTAGLDLLRNMARLLEVHIGGSPLLQIAAQPFAGPVPLHWNRETTWAGMFMPGPRVALISEAADRELAAYVLARTSLRRSGTDPRAIKRAYVVNTDERFIRHLTRLWVGVELGPPTVSSSFAGPVTHATASAFAEAYRECREHPDIEVLCPGGTVERADDPHHYIAPALLACDWPGPDLALPGPMLLIIRSNPEQARGGAEAALREGGQVVALGVRRHELDGDVRHIEGALLTDRLPPGLPEPRPV